MDDKRTLVISFNSVWIGISSIAIAARLLTRYFLIQLVGADDVLITIAFFLALACSSLPILMTKYGLGLHVQYLMLGNVPTFTKAMASVGLVYNLCHMFIKLSYLALYLRIAPTTRFRVILYISMALVSVLGIANATVSMATCIPFSKVWNPDIPGRCINIRSFYISAGTLNMFFDFVIFVLPIPIVWGLKLPQRQRLALVGVFGIGLIIIIASILRLYNIINLLNSLPRSTVGSLNLSTVEIHLALLLSCIPTFKALVQRYFPGFLGSSRGTRFTSSGGYVLQSRSRNKSNFKNANLENVKEGNENGSKQYIVEDIEMMGFEAVVPTRSPSKASADGQCY